MSHYKYLGVLEPSTENITIDCIFLEDPINITLPLKNKWNVIAAMDEYKSMAMICIQSNNFSIKHIKKRICKKYFRAFAIISTTESIPFVQKFLNDENDYVCESGYILHDSKQFAIVCSPNGWAKGKVYKYFDENNNITAIEISFK